MHETVEEFETLQFYLQTMKDYRLQEPDYKFLIAASFNLASLRDELKINLDERLRKEQQERLMTNGK